MLPSRRNYAMCFNKKKKGNGAEGIKPQTICMPEPGISPNSFTFLSPFLPQQSVIGFQDCIVFLLMATLCTSQMNA